MIEAFAWGFGAAFSLVIGSWVAIRIKLTRRLIGLIMAFGVGVLTSAVSFELIDQAFRSTNRASALVVGLVSGALVFFVGDLLIDKMGGRSHRKQGGATEGTGLAILLGTILDGIPESIVIGLTLVRGGAVSTAMVVAVFISNVPEAIGATYGLRASGWNRRRILALWMAVAIISAIAAWAGYAFFDTASANVLAFTLAFAGGALLTMMADSMMPEAYKDSGKLAGLMTTLGFGLAYVLSLAS
jgi:zinc transporter, ZIP family